MTAGRISRAQYPSTFGTSSRCSTSPDRSGSSESLPCMKFQPRPTVIGPVRPKSAPSSTNDAEATAAAVRDDAPGAAAAMARRMVSSAMPAALRMTAISRRDLLSRNGRKASLKSMKAAPGSNSVRRRKRFTGMQ